MNILKRLVDGNFFNVAKSIVDVLPESYLCVLPCLNPRFIHLYISIRHRQEMMKRVNYIASCLKLASIDECVICLNIYDMHDGFAFGGTCESCTTKRRFYNFNETVTVNLGDDVFTFPSLTGILTGWTRVINRKECDYCHGYPRTCGDCLTYFKWGKVDYTKYVPAKVVYERYQKAIKLKK